MAADSQGKQEQRQSYQMHDQVGAAVQFENVPFSMEEVLFDPQTSGGLLMAAAPDEAEKLEQELQNAGLPARIVGTITEPGEVEIFVRG